MLRLEREMENWVYEQKQTDLQVALRKYILTGSPNNMTTLSFRKNVSKAYARKCFGRLTTQLKRELFGWKSRKRILMFPVVEGTGPDERIHIHCVMQLPGDPLEHKDLVRRLWLQSSGACGDPNIYCPGSDAWFLVLDTEKKQRILANYCVKTCAKDHYSVLWDFVPRWLMK